MDRRSSLRTAGVAASAAAGCLSGRDEAVGERERGASGPTPTPPPLSGGDEDFGSGFTDGGAWSSHCFDAARTGYNPNTDPPRGEVGPAWFRTPVRGQRTSWTTPPVTDDSRVYVGSGAGGDDRDGRRGGFVAALDGESGERRWLTTVTTGRVRGLVHIDGRILAVTDADDASTPALTALDAADGSEQWTVELPSTPRGGPAVLDGTAYVTSHEGGLTAVSPDGTRLWGRAVGDGEEYASSRPCAVDSTVFVGTDRGRVVGFAADDERQVWRNRIVEGGHRPRIQNLPTVIDGTVFVTATNYHLYAVDAADGTVQWGTRLLEQSHGNAIPSVAAVDDTVYVNTIHGGLLAIARSDGSERWRAGEYGGSLPPAAGDLVVAPTSGGGVQSYSTSGDRRWTFDMPAFDVGMAGYVMRPRVALAHDRAYVSLNDGRVFSLGARGE